MCTNLFQTSSRGCNGHIIFYSASKHPKFVSWSLSRSSNQTNRQIVIYSQENKNDSPWVVVEWSSILTNTLQAISEKLNPLAEKAEAITTLATHTTKRAHTEKVFSKKRKPSQIHQENKENMKILKKY